MSKINGVHALLAFLVQQSQHAKFGNGKTDVKQLELLLQESHLLNERLLKIEKILTPLAKTAQHLDIEAVSHSLSAEGHWPTASVVQDTINKQERLQAFGYWHADDSIARDTEPFRYQDAAGGDDRDSLEKPQIFIQRYAATLEDIEMANLSANFGMINSDSRRTPQIQDRSASLNEDGGRLVLIAIGLALILFTLFLSF
jgi:hypothetical protein